LLSFQKREFEETDKKDATASCDGYTLFIPKPVETINGCRYNDASGNTGGVFVPGVAFVG